MLQCVLLPLLMLPQHTHKHTCWHILKIPVAYRIINRYMHTYKRAYKHANHSVKDLWSHFSQCPGSTRPFNTKKDVPTFLSAFNGLTEHLDLHLWLQRLYELVPPQKTVFSPHLSWATDERSDYQRSCNGVTTCLNTYLEVIVAILL